MVRYVRYLLLQDISGVLSILQLLLQRQIRFVVDDFLLHRFQDAVDPGLDRHHEDVLWKINSVSGRGVG